MAPAQIYRDGIAGANNPVKAPTSSPRAACHVGGGATESASGHYGEILIYNRPLPPSEHAAIVSYLRSRWAFP